MDPALQELLRKGDPSDEVAVVLRLARDVPPSGVRIVSRFGEIATARIARRSIPELHRAEEIRSVKAPRHYGPDWVQRPSIESNPWDLRATDERRPEGLGYTGRGIVLALVDWGLDVAHPDFRNDDGSTRILALWDQRSRKDDQSNNRYGYGWVHDKNTINAALRHDDPYAMLAYHPADTSDGPTHGTHTAGIAAGNGRSGGPAGMAPEADIVFVHMSTATGEEGENLGDSAALLEAIDFIANVAGSRPWVLNLSMGRQAGPHDGRTLTELGIDAALEVAPGRACIQSTGNYFSRPVHTQGLLRPGEVREIGFHTGREDGFAHEIDIWYSGSDRVTVEVIEPAKGIVGHAATGGSSELAVNGRKVGRLYNRRHDPNNHDNQAHVYLDAEAPRGTWTLRLIGTDVVDGRYHCWVERDPGCSLCQPSFEFDVVHSSTTGTICNGYLSIAVGAYDAHQLDWPLSTFSSGGPTRDGRQKPDLVAPGVDVLSCRSAGRRSSLDDPKQVRMSGTSMAAPYVAGVVALMFQAARQLIPVRHTRELLLNAARPLTNGEPQFRWGSGYCDVVAAVTGAEAVRLLPATSSALEASMPWRLPNSFLARSEAFPKLTEPSVLMTRNRSISMESESDVPHPCGCKKEAVATLLSRILADPAVFVRRLEQTPVKNEIEVIARGGERLRKQPLQGDIIIRVVEGGSAHASIVASNGLWLAEDLKSRGLRADQASRGGHVHVEEGNPVPREASERYARRLTDPTGRLLEDLLILRLLYPTPTVVKVDQPIVAAGGQVQKDAPKNPTGRELPTPPDDPMTLSSPAVEPEEPAVGSATVVDVPPIESDLADKSESIEPVESGPGTRKPAAKDQPGPTALPLDVALVAEFFVYKADANWAPEGDPLPAPISGKFKPVKLKAGDWFIPRIELHISFDPPNAFPERTILEVRVSNVFDPKTARSQAAFWRLVANRDSGIKSLDPLGPQPGNVPSSSFLSSPTGDSPVLGPLQGSIIQTQTPNSTQTIQATSQIQGASSVLQLQGGLNLDPGGPLKLLEKVAEQLPGVGFIAKLIGVTSPATAQVATQRTPQPPTYSVTFTVDLAVKSAIGVTVPDLVCNVRFETPIPDLSYNVSFANDQSIITADETTKFLVWLHEKGVGVYPGLREAIREGKVPVIITGKASVRGHEHHADHNFSLSQQRVEAVRLLLQGKQSAAKGGRTEGGAIGAEAVSLEAQADGDFHDPQPTDKDQDRVVQIFIDGIAATAAVRSEAISSAETGKLLSWVQTKVGAIPHLREAIRTGMVPVLITGQSALQGDSAGNLTLSKRQVEAVRRLLQGEASSLGGGRTAGGILGSESVKIDAAADGEFHDPKPADDDRGRVVQVFIDPKAAAEALQKINDK